jgi:hypothetical protein
VVQYFGFSIWRGKHVEKKIVDAQFMADWWSFDSGFDNKNEMNLNVENSRNSPLLFCNLLLRKLECVQWRSHGGAGRGPALQEIFFPVPPLI